MPSASSKLFGTKTPKSTSNSPRTLRKTRPEEIDDSEVTQDYDIFSINPDVDPRDAARIFGDKYKSLVGLLSNLKTAEAAQGLELYCRMADLSSEAQTDARRELAEIGAQRPRDTRGLHGQIQGTFQVLEKLGTAMENVTDERDRQHLLFDLPGSTAASQRASIQDWLEANMDTLSTMGRFLTLKDDMAAKGTSLGKVNIHFTRHPPQQNPDGPSSGLRKITSRFPGRAKKLKNAVEEKMWEGADEVATQITDTFLQESAEANPATWWRPIISLPSTIAHSLCTIASTAKNVAQSFGARHFPKIDVFHLLWTGSDGEGHVPYNSGSILGQIETRYRGEIPEEWGWADPTVTVDLTSLEEVTKLVGTWSKERIAQSTLQSINKEKVEWTRRKKRESRADGWDQESQRSKPSKKSGIRSWF